MVHAKNLHNPSYITWAQSSQVGLFSVHLQKHAQVTTAA